MGVFIESTLRNTLLYTEIENGALIHYAAAAAAAKSLQSCLTLCDPIDGNPPGSPGPGILQARTLEWVAIYFLISFLSTGDETVQVYIILLWPWYKRNIVNTLYLLLISYLFLLKINHSQICRSYPPKQPLFNNHSYCRYQ